MKVISGGQTGVDVAALRAAQVFGLRTGGFAPTGWKTTAGAKPQLETTFKLEVAHGGYSHRTRLNVETAHATLILANTFDSPGTRLTLAAAQASGKPICKVQIPNPGPQGISMPLADIEGAAYFIKAEADKLPVNAEFILNVAGNSSATREGVFLPAFVILCEVFFKLATLIDVIEADHLAHVKQRLLNDPRLIHALIDNYDYYGELDPRGLRGLIV